jgi:hypothetical protein
MNTRKRNKTVLLLAIMVMTWLGSVANADGLIAYWPFEDGSGDIAHDAAGGNNGQLVAGEFEGDPLPTWVSPGKVGDGALKFNGDNSVNCGTGVTTASDLTVALWVKVKAYGHHGPVQCTTGGYSTNPGWSVMLRTDTPQGGVWFRIDGTGGAWDGGDLQINEELYEPDTWVHVVCTFKGTTREQKCYINGVLKGTDTAAEGRSVANTTGDLMFGRSWGGDLVLDEVAIWDNVLSQAEVTDVYVSGVAFDPNAPYVNSGSDTIILSDMSVDMDASITNNDTQDPNRPLGLEWTAVPSAGVVFEPNEFVLNPTVTITDLAPNDPTTYKLTLSAQLINPSGPPEVPSKDSMNIEVYSDACKARIADGDAPMYDSSDFNTDCVTDLKDFAESAAKWKKDYTLSASPEKPAEEEE